MEHSKEEFLSIQMGGTLEKTIHIYPHITSPFTIV
jgi:hypothetical protein